jgi:hypothetical protein
MTRFIQDYLVVCQSCQELVWGMAARQRMRGGQALAVLLHLVAAEQL